MENESVAIKEFNLFQKSNELMKLPEVNTNQLSPKEHDLSGKCQKMIYVSSHYREGKLIQAYQRKCGQKHTALDIMVDRIVFGPKPFEGQEHLLVSGDTQNNQQNNEMSSLERFKQQIQAAYDMTKNYFQMQWDSTIGGDDYFHCKANYEATERGKAGEEFAQKWGNIKEYVDFFRNILEKGLTLGDAFQDLKHDITINADGRQLAKDGVYSSSKEACDKYRVNGINEKY